jgi:hypothetical protein
LRRGIGGNQAEVKPPYQQNARAGVGQARAAQGIFQFRQHAANTHLAVCAQVQVSDDAICGAQWVFFNDISLTY